ncbi:tetratricopeptide repeat protein [Flavobacterium cerinum]|uniref:Tetratricopeptide repeat protein n=1 Tax=Flavobacterium cerinum TaxID=2502784 RepID=A0ABY5ISA8_9FLAO|nr:tetratricopeptide repeat protein [Flavobacterium cerinum]UUC45176.1 tetratricopeptide repeat protein [Flavobacterium cerinum]
MRLLKMPLRITKQTGLGVIMLLLLSATAFSQSQDNPELQKMADDDQNARKSENIDWNILSKEDKARRERVFQLFKEEKVKTAKDYLNAGIVFQHGSDTIDSAMAVKSFEKAIQLDETLNKWWYAAAVDRDLMRRGEPQIYGTQFTKKNGPDAKWERYKIDPTKVTDAQRKYYKVETLAEQEEKIRTMNLKSIPSYYNTTKAVDPTIKLIKQEFKRGKESEYNISEESVNTFGYELLQSGKNEDALKIFKLNTELYPKGFNTYDSYGEVLMLTGQTKKAIKAYKKSLELNPENENARTILESKKG